jgi:putative membrane protein
MLSISHLPHLNAILNALAACFLIGGLMFIKTGNRDAHRLCMVIALIISSLFLISYIIHRFYVPIFVFQGEGGVRIFYYILLISHVFLAITIVPLIAITVVRALRKKFTAHKNIAKWTWPIWMYVSISGIIVYLMLYQLYPLKTASLL